MRHPRQQFDTDRQRARDAQDPMANLCTVANRTDDGVEQRTLVLRDVGDDLAIFVNASSPKWPHLQAGLALLTYWPSVQVQYRIQAQVQPVEAQLVADSWQMRPDAPKRMDWFYQLCAPQSSAVSDRQTLLDEVEHLQLPQPLIAPDQARGLRLLPTQIERLDLTQDNGIHDRQRFTLTEASWQQQTLVP